MSGNSAERLRSGYHPPNCGRVHDGGSRLDHRRLQRAGAGRRSCPARGSAQGHQVALFHQRSSTVRFDLAMPLHAGTVEQIIQGLQIPAECGRGGGSRAAGSPHRSGRRERVATRTAFSSSSSE